MSDLSRASTSSDLTLPDEISPDALPREQHSPDALPDQISPEALRLEEPGSPMREEPGSPMREEPGSPIDDGLLPDEVDVVSATVDKPTCCTRDCMGNLRASAEAAGDLNTPASNTPASNTPRPIPPAPRRLPKTSRTTHSRHPNRTPTCMFSNPNALERFHVTSLQHSTKPPVSSTAILLVASAP